MATKRPGFITKPLSGYHHREVPKEDDYLTHVGPGTPAGEYLRRFWQPVAYSSRLKDLPLRVEVMGEELVVFRDGRGEIGLLELHCSHRGTSLEFGLIEERGLRCCYHGWLFDTAGRILDTPLEPPNSTLKDRLCHGAYPVKEYNGIAFAYMGPPDKVPEFPAFDLFTLPGHTLEHAALPGMDDSRPCNWMQLVDNFLDPLHEEFLHARVSGVQFYDKEDKLLDELAILGQGEWVETPTGVMTLDVRRVDDCIWVRSIEYIYPNMISLSDTPAAHRRTCPGAPRGGRPGRHPLPQRDAQGHPHGGARPGSSGDTAIPWEDHSDLWRRYGATNTRRGYGGGGQEARAQSWPRCGQKAS